MDEDFQKKVADAIANPKNMGEMEAPDAVGTVGSPGCGDMVRMWIKFKEENGRKIIDRASFQTFGCETAIAVASLATELVRGKTPEEALAFSGQDLAAELGPLPPMKIHCGQLVEGALRSALGGEKQPEQLPPSPHASLLDQFTPPKQERKIIFLDPTKES
jgi:nitrogen fixation protein NifU and related proteins